MALDVIGLGALNLDQVYRLEWPRLNKKLANFIHPGSELALNDSEFQHLFGIIKQIGTLVGKSGGGQAANTVVALSRMGISCGYVGKLGADEAGRNIRMRLKGVDKRGLVTDKRSGHCLSLLNAEGERCTLINPGCNDKLALSDVKPDYLKQARLLYFSSFVSDKQLQLQTQIARKLSPSIDLALDPGELYARRGLLALEELLGRCRLLFITDKEIELLTGKKYKAGTKQILALGVEIIICKRGEKGAYVLSGKEEFELPVEKVSAVDKTGAGDVFAAGFIAGLFNGLKLKKCTLLGHKAAIQSMMGVGRKSYPDKDFLSQTIQEL